MTAVELSRYHNIIQFAEQVKTQALATGSKSPPEK